MQARSPNSYAVRIGPRDGTATPAAIGEGQPPAPAGRRCQLHPRMKAQADILEALQAMLAELRAIRTLLEARGEKQPER